MARGKTTPVMWYCQQCQAENGHGALRSDLVKELIKKRSCPVCKAHTEHKPKAVKKGGTKKHN